MNLRIKDVLTRDEAVVLAGVSPNTLKNKALSGAFTKDEFRQTDKGNWLFTRQGIERVFGIEPRPETVERNIAETGTVEGMAIGRALGAEKGKKMATALLAAIERGNMDNACRVLLQIRIDTDIEMEYLNEFICNKLDNSYIYALISGMVGGYTEMEAKK